MNRFPVRYRSCYDQLEESSRPVVRPVAPGIRRNIFQGYSGGRLGTSFRNHQEKTTPESS